MDFVDWRKAKDANSNDENVRKQRAARFRGRGYESYVEEQIRQAQERGDFENLAGFGKPLKFVENVYAGDKAAAYNMLESNGYAPAEVELVKEIRQQRERAEAIVTRLAHRNKTLRQRRVQPFLSEKQAYNRAVEKVYAEYEKSLRALNSKILTLNLIAPSPMHQQMIDIEQQLQHFREVCPLFENII